MAVASLTVKMVNNPLGCCWVYLGGVRGFRSKPFSSKRFQQAFSKRLANAKQDFTVRLA